MHKKIYIEGETDQKISAYLEMPKQADDSAPNRTVVLMVHNFPGNKNGNQNLFKELETTIAQKGYGTLRFDFQGCGESDGKEEYFTLKSAGADLRRMMNWCRQEGFENFIIIAEGLGASVACMNISPDVKALILISGILDLQDYGQKLLSIANPEDVKKEDRHYVTVKDHRINKEFLSDLDTTNLVTCLHTIQCPVLIMHGARDAIAEIGQIDLARRHIPARRLEITVFEDGDHHLHSENHRKYMFYHTMQFIEKYA